MSVRRRVSDTVREAGDIWLDGCAARGVQRATIKSYRSHLNFHVYPFIGEVQLVDLNVTVARSLQHRLLMQGRSAALVNNVIGNLCSLISDASALGHAAPEMAARIRASRDRKRLRRRKAIGTRVEMPTPDELRQILQHASGCQRLMIYTAAFTGLRSSELLGLSWRHVLSTANWSTSDSGLMEMGPYATSKHAQASVRSR